MLVALQQFCGGFPMLNFTATIFQESGSNLTPNTSSIIVGIVQILGAIICTFLVEKAGRKFLFLTSALGVCIGLGIMSLYTYLSTHGTDLASLNWIPLVSFSFVMFIYNLGVNTLPFMYVSEIVELKNKRFTMTFCLTILYIFSTIVIQVILVKHDDGDSWHIYDLFAPQFLLTLINLLGMHGLLLLFSINSLVGALFILCFLPETKGKTYEEIMTLISG